MSPVPAAAGSGREEWQLPPLPWYLAGGPRRRGGARSSTCRRSGSGPAGRTGRWPWPPRRATAAASRPAPGSSGWNGAGPAGPALRPPPLCVCGAGRFGGGFKAAGGPRHGTSRGNGEQRCPGGARNREHRGSARRRSKQGSVAPLRWRGTQGHRAGPPPQRPSRNGRHGGSPTAQCAPGLLLTKLLLTHCSVT